MGSGEWGSGEWGVGSGEGDRGVGRGIGEWGAGSGERGVGSGEWGLFLVLDSFADRGSELQQHATDLVDLGRELLCGRVRQKSKPTTNFQLCIDFARRSDCNR